MQRLNRATVVILFNLILIGVTNTSTGERQFFIADEKAENHLKPLSGTLSMSLVDGADYHDLISKKEDVPDGIIHVTRVHMQLKDVFGTLDEKEKISSIDYVCHHKNGCHYDNRVENIEVLTRPQHGRVHGEMRRQKQQPATIKEVLCSFYTLPEVDNLLYNLELLCDRFLAKDGTVIRVTDDIFKTRFTLETCENLVAEYRK